MNVGNFKSSQDYQDQMDRYRETLRLQIKNANREAELNRTAWSSNGEFKPQPVAPTQYRSVEEEQADRSLQLQNAQKSLNMIFKYPADAKKTFDLIMADYDPAEFNKYLPEFLTEIKNAKDITPSLFFNQWERFITIMRSRGDNFVKIGPNDDKAKILLEQQRSGIEKFIKENIDSTVPALTKSKILGEIKRAVELGDKDGLLDRGYKALIEASKQPVNEDEINVEMEKAIQDYIDQNEEKYAEFGISREEIRVPPNVEARLLGEVINDLKRQRNSNLVKAYIFENRELLKVPNMKKVEELKERLQEKFKRKKEFSAEIGELEKYLAEAENKYQQELYEYNQEKNKIEENLIKYRQLIPTQISELEDKDIPKAYIEYKKKVEGKEPVRGSILPRVKEMRDFLLSNEALKNIMEYAKQDLEDKFNEKYEKPQKPNKKELTNEFYESRGVEGLFEPQIPRTPQLSRKSSQELSTPQLSRKSSQELSTPTEEQLTLQFEEIPLLEYEEKEIPQKKVLKSVPQLKVEPTEQNIALLREYGLLKKTNNVTTNKEKIKKAWKELTKGNNKDIRTLKNSNEFNEEALVDYLRNDILERLNITQQGQGIKSKRSTTKGGFLPMLLASTLLPALIGNGKQPTKPMKSSSKKSSKKIKIISV